MARIAGVDLPPQKRIWVGLTAIYGIGLPRARSLCVKADVEYTKKIKDLTEEEINALRQAIEVEGRVEGDLRKEVQMNIRRLIEIQCYRGLRHRRTLPAPSQRRTGTFDNEIGNAVGYEVEIEARVLTWQKNRSSRTPHRRQEKQFRRRRKS